MLHKKRAYSSDLTLKQWRQLRPLLGLARKGPGRPIELDMHHVLNAIFYVLRTGCQWHNLPHDFPNYNSVFYHYNK